MSVENVVNSTTLVTFQRKKWSKHSPFFSATDVVSESKDSSKSVCNYEWKTRSFDAIPDWLGPNPYLLSGHRPELKSAKACLLSTFRLHVDTGNIWSHIIGALLFLSLGVYELILSENASSLDFTEKVVLFLFFTGVVICMSFSAIYHIMLCHSRAVEIIFLRLDFAGIIITTVCHYIPSIYYGFHCSPKSMAFYLTVCILLGIFTIFLLMVDKYSHPEYRSLRAGVFACNGSFGLIPIAHYIIDNWHLLFEEILITKASLCLLLMACLYFLGAWLYSQQIPEKYFPGKCDYLFHSHQLFHILVVLGVVVHYIGFTALSQYVRQLPKNFCEIQN